MTTSADELSSPGVLVRDPSWSEEADAVLRELRRRRHGREVLR